MTDILRPTDEAEAAALVKQSASTATPIEMVGGGTRAGLGHPILNPTKISTTGMDGISLYEPGALTVVARAGTPFTDIERELDKEGQHLPFEPANYAGLLGNTGNSTIGGIVSCGVSGPRRIQAGACRDSLIGVRFINGEGETVSNGGRVMKNVTGYDLVKLLCGSHGTLGLITEVSFKLLPKPEYAQTLQVAIPDIKDAVSAMSDALTSPYDVTGAAYTSHPTEGEPRVFIRVEGFENAVAYRVDKLKEILGTYGEISTLDDETRQIWADIRDVRQFADQPGAIWRISVKPGDAPELSRNLSVFEGCKTLFDWGGGLIWALLPEDGDCGAERIRESVNKVGGHATLFRASPETKKNVQVFHPQHPGIAALTKSIKTGFDPINILNSGRMGI